MPVGLGTGRDQGQRQWVRRRALRGITEELGELKARIARMRVSHFCAFFLRPRFSVVGRVIYPYSVRNRRAS